jgi:hypothetical protein
MGLANEGPVQARSGRTGGAGLDWLRAERAVKGLQVIRRRYMVESLSNPDQAAGDIQPGGFFRIVGSFQEFRQVLDVALA